jgi:hypothetical protein
VPPKGYSRGVSHIIEPATSGRAQCRACGTAIARGELRFGEREPNPFGEGEATWWFHLRCGACKRPEAFLATLESTAERFDHAELERLARRGLERPLLTRIARAEHDPSGRARCRHCRSAITKGDWRIGLNLWEHGRFGPAGFLHVGCSEGYFGTSEIVEHVISQTPGLHRDDVLEIECMLA